MSDCALCDSDPCRLDEILKPGFGMLVTVDNALAILNHALFNDRRAFQTLVGARVQCNELTANHPTIEVETTPDQKKYALGFLGVLNGLFGLTSDGETPIRALYSGDGELIKFCRWDRVPNMPPDPQIEGGDL